MGCPPSIVIASPEIEEAASESRKTHLFATFSGRAMRPCGMARHVLLVAVLLYASMRLCVEPVQASRVVVEQHRRRRVRLSMREYALSRQRAEGVIHVFAREMGA